MVVVAAAAAAVVEGSQGSDTSNLLEKAPLSLMSVERHIRLDKTRTMRSCQQLRASVGAVRRVFELDCRALLGPRAKLNQRR